MENRAHAIAAGIFTLLLAVALAATGFWFRKDDIKLAHYVVTTTSSVSGLKAEAAVQYRGVEVGHVDSIRIEPGVSGRINIRIAVQEETPVTRSTYAQLGYQGVTGLAYIALNDDGSSKELIKAADREPLRIGMRPSPFDSGLDMLATLNEVSGRLKELLSKDNVRLVNKALDGIEQASHRIAILAERLEPGAGDFPALVKDARSAAARAEKLMAKLEERVGVLDSVATSAEEVGGAARSVNEETLPRLNALIEQLNRDTRALDRVLNTLGENPQSFVFGAPRGKPGPGEAGFRDGGR
jgi:phospholipid/cholesterol/gamma-HCH transport system substrate-binding protein